jgi:hypothetical protein
MVCFVIFLLNVTLLVTPIFSTPARCQSRGRDFAAKYGIFEHKQLSCLGAKGGYTYIYYMNTETHVTKDHKFL